MCFDKPLRMVSLPKMNFPSLSDDYSLQNVGDRHSAVRFNSFTIISTFAQACMFLLSFLLQHVVRLKPALKQMIFVVVRDHLKLLPRTRYKLGIGGGTHISVGVFDLCLVFLVCVIRVRAIDASGY